jgi:Copper type II ascorbate-dependent monooxygenase, C-terminal domain
MREVTVPARMIMPGEEITMCREVRLGNVTPMLVRSIHVSIPRGSHHVIVYRSRATDEQLDLTPCRGLSGIISGTAPLFIAQQPESGIDFPAGVGLSIGANQMIRLEEHFINTSSAPLMVGARVRFDLAPTDGLTPADMMFWGTQSIRVAPRSMGSATYFRPALPGINVFGLTSHTHQFGVRSTIEVASSATGMGREVHRSETWEEPPLTRFSPPLTFSGGEGLRLVCNYNNTSDRTLTFGESYYEEMCFLWAYYYPSMGFHLCFDGLCRALPL